jgi:Flp pilus assembly protein TadD
MLKMSKSVGLWRQFGEMSIQKLLRIAPVLALSLSWSSSAWGACDGPQALEARLRAHPDSEANIQLGVWFGDHHQYACAFQRLQAALEFEPASPRIFYLIGLTYYASGQATEAVTPLQNAIRLDSKNLDTRLILAAALSQLRRDEEAQTQWEEALKIDPSSKVAMDGLAKTLIAGGHYTAVISLLNSTARNEAMTLDLALAYAGSGNLPEASTVLNQALRTHPSSLDLTNALITVYVNQNRYQDAAKLAEKMVKLYPGNLRAETTYLGVLILNDEFEQARPVGKKLLAKAPHDFESLYLNGVLHREAGEYATARSLLEEAVGLNPNHYNSRYNLGVVLTKLADYNGAKEHLEKAIELGGTEPQIRFELVTVLRNLGETEQAQEQLKIYQQELQERANRTLAAGKAAEAEQEFSRGNIQMAVELYREAVTATPRDALLNYKLALALDRAGDTTNERTALNRAVEIDPDLAVAQNQLGYLASLQGELSSAENYFRLALRSAPGYIQAWISLAATLAMEYRFSEAQEAVTIALRLDPQNTSALQLRRDLAVEQSKH